jgi:hypothetical protein
MKERTMILTDSEVQAIQRRLRGGLGGMFQLRREMKPQPWKCPSSGDWWLAYAHGNSRSVPVESLHSNGNIDILPFRPGDLIRVCEAWVENDGFIYHRANNTDVSYPAFNWQPASKMPARAARYWLPVLSVRVQRVQELTEADAVACGYVRNPLVGGFDLTAKGAYSYRANVQWESNPWQWVYEIGEPRTENPMSDIRCERCGAEAEMRSGKHGFYVISNGSDRSTKKGVCCMTRQCDTEAAAKRAWEGLRDRGARWTASRATRGLRITE